MRALTLGLLLFWPGAALAGAWAREAGETYLKGSLTYLESAESFDGTGDAMPILGEGAAYADGRYTEAGTSLYVEFGLSRRLTLIGSGTLKSARTEGQATASGTDLSETTTGAGDLWLGARWPLLTRRIVASIQPEVKIPLSNPANRPLYSPSLGSGAVDAGAMLQLGGSIPRLRAYWTGGAGFRVRGGIDPNETRWDLEAGADLGPRFQLRVRYDGVDSKQETLPPGVTMDPIRSANAGGQDYQRLQPTVAFRINPTVEASLGVRRTLAGKNTLRDTQWELGFSYQGPARPDGSP